MINTELKNKFEELTNITKGIEDSVIVDTVFKDCENYDKAVEVINNCIYADVYYAVDNHLFTNTEMYDLVHYGDDINISRGIDISKVKFVCSKYKVSEKQKTVILIHCFTAK